MKQTLYMAIGVVILIVAGFIAFKSIKKTTPQTTESPPSSAEWIGTEKRIVSDCQKQPKFTTRKTMFAYASKLVAALDSTIKYDDFYQMYAAPEGTNFEIRDLTPNDTSSSCVAAWVGGAKGSSRVAYESATGDIKTLTVQDYPTPTPTETPPVPSPTPDI